jgi:hypothetical protein
MMTNLKLRMNAWVEHEAEHQCEDTVEAHIMMKTKTHTYGCEQGKAHVLSITNTCPVDGVGAHGTTTGTAVSSSS